MKNTIHSLPVISLCSWLLLLVAGCSGEAAPSAASSSSVGTADDLTACNDDSDCQSNEMCKYPSSTCGQSSQGGTCARRDIDCPATYAPVCGCDGITYTNACYATQYGANVFTHGECPIPCSGNDDCSETQFCQFNGDMCAVPGMTSGSCQPRPKVCPRSYRPVCGCDGASYTNLCEAQRAGTGRAGPGGCPEDEGLAGTSVAGHNP